MRRIVEQADPRRIGIDVSASFALADGLSHTEHRLLVEALGPYAERLVPAEDLVVGWLETRLPEEIARPARAQPAGARGHRRGLLPRRGRAWGRRRRWTSPGGSASASPTSASTRGSSPTVDLQRAGVPLVEERGTALPAVPYDAVIEPGDLVHCDVGLTSLGLRTDTQRNGYVLRPGETDGAGRAAGGAAPRPTGCRT